MQVAEILSDLTSLRACGHTEALALVNVSQTAQPSGSNQNAKTNGDDDSKDSQLARAKELVDLHFGVKVKHMNGPGGEPTVDEDLRRAREGVNRVLRDLRD